MINPNLIINTATELGFSLKSNGELHKIINKIETFKPKNNEDSLILNDQENNIIKTINSELNELKKLRMIDKILKSALTISNMEDINNLKDLKIDNIIEIDPSITAKINEILVLIQNKEEFFNNLNAKDDDVLIKDYDLMPYTTLKIICMFSVSVFSFIASYISFSHLLLSKKQDFLNDTTAFWIMLLATLLFVYCINSVIRNISLKIKEIQNKEQIFRDLVKNFLVRKEKAKNKSIKSLRKKQFEIEKKFIKNSAIIKLKEISSEEVKLLNNLKTNFI